MVTRQYLNLKFDKKSFENKTEVNKDTRFFKLPYFSKYSKIFQTNIWNLVKNFFKDIDANDALTHSHHSRSATKFHININYQFIFKHLLFTNLFVQTVGFDIWVKPKSTSSPESMNTYRKTLSLTSSNICENQVYILGCTIRTVFQ